MFASLRSRFLLSFALISGAILLVFGLVLLPLSLIPTRIALEENVGRLVRASRAGQRLLVAEDAPPSLPAWRERLSRLVEDYEVRLLLLQEVGANGRVLVRYDSQNAWQGTTYDPVSLPARQLTVLPPDLPPDATLERLRTPDGTSWLVLTRPLRTASDTAVLALAVPEVSQLEAFRLFFLRPVLWAVLIAAVLAFILALLLSRWITRPLQKLVTATEAVAAGDYEHRLEANGPSEVKRVAHSFNTMAGQVAQTQQAQRDFVANVSHDLKTPLTSVQGWSQALLDGAAQSPEQRIRAAKVIYAETERMALLVNQLLALARLESGQMRLKREVVDLTAVVENSVRGLRWLAAEKEIALTAETTPLTCVGDAERLQQALSNLIENGLKYTPEGGKVWVVLRVEEQDPHTAVVSVCDTGTGIPPADLERIWERFYQVDKARSSGTPRSIGLGLAIVKQLIEAHGGTVAATSQLGEGSCFTMRLPCQQV